MFYLAIILQVFVNCDSIVNEDFLASAVPVKTWARGTQGSGPQPQCLTQSEGNVGRRGVNPVGRNLNTCRTNKSLQITCKNSKVFSCFSWYYLPRYKHIVRWTYITFRFHLSFTISHCVDCFWLIRYYKRFCIEM